MCQISPCMPARVSCYVNTIKGHPDCFHGCQSSNNTNGHHDRFILFWRQREELKRPGAVSCLHRGMRGQSRNYCGILMLVQGRFRPLTSVYAHPAISTLLIAVLPLHFPFLIHTYFTHMTWSLNKSISIYHTGVYVSKASSYRLSS